MSNKSLIEEQIKRFRRILALIRKEIDFMSKDKVSLGILFILPLLIIFIAGTATISLESPPEPVWLFDQDQTELSGKLVEAFLESENMTVYDSAINNTHSIELAEEILPTKAIAAYIIIPEGFEIEFKANQTSDLAIYVDSLDFFQAMSIEGYINGVLINFQLGEGVFSSQLFFFPDFQPELAVDILFLGAPGILSICLFSSMNLISSQCIVGDIPLRRLLIAPTQRFEVIIAKTITYGGIAFIQTLTCLFLVEFIFGLELTGNFLDIAIVVFLSAFCGVTMGIAFSVISSTRLQAAQMFLLVFTLDLMIMMRMRIEILLKFIPLDQGKQAIINIGYRGLGLFDQKVLEPTINMFLTAMLCFVLSIIMFQRKKELV